MNKAIVTGASGFLGRALVRDLFRQGVEVLAIVRESVELPCRLVQASIERPFLLDEFLDAGTVVFHLAAHASVAGSVRDPRYDFDVNVASFIEILESVRRSGASLVFPSSSAVFDPDQPLPHSETARKRPVSPYGAAKLSCEGYCAVYHSCYGVNVKVARLFNVYGPGMRRFAIHDFYQKLRTNPATLEILGDGRQTRDYLYVDDLVRGLQIVAERGVPGEDYNLATGIPTNLSDLARRVATILGRPDIIITTRGKSFPGDIPHWYADIRKVQALGFQPTISMTEGIMATIKWFDRVYSRAASGDDSPSSVNGWEEGRENFQTVEPLQRK